MLFSTQVIILQELASGLLVLLSYYCPHREVSNNCMMITGTSGLSVIGLSLEKNQNLAKGNFMDIFLGKFN